VFKVLKEKYGTSKGKSGQETFWEQGVESPKIKSDAYSKMVQEGSKSPQEAYVDILGIKDIVTQKNNWPMFEDVFNIPMKGEPKGKAHYVGWLAKFNEIRRIPAHPSLARTYEEADYELMRHIKFEFYRRRNTAMGIKDPEQES
jgi:DNA sulfur modification protein DndB